MRLGQELLVCDGQVTLKGLEDLALRRPEQVSLSTQLAQIAQSFTDRLVAVCPWVRLVAISGSTAYAGSNPRDDVDFYIVTRRNRLWVTLLFAMLTARFQHMENPDSPPLCFNRIEEDDECRYSFRTPQDPLFARESLSLRVLDGQAYYAERVKSAIWMEHLFPRLYCDVVKNAAARTRADDAHSDVWSIVNEIAFMILPPYLAFVGAWRNRRLTRQARYGARFRTVIRRGYFAYESNKYDRLREIYQKVF
jgi:hypothetical protein